jgi:hypothetical protein
MSKPQIKVLVQDLENTVKKSFAKKHWLLLIDAAITVIILLIILILLRHTPADYRPQVGFEKRISPYVTNQIIPQLYNGVQKREPFELTINQIGLNEAITSFGWPKMYGNGLIVSTPTVIFEPNNLRLMAKVNLNAIDTVVTVEISPHFDEKGMLNLNIDNVKLGNIPVTFIAKQLAKKMSEEQIQGAQADNIASSALISLLTGRQFEAIFSIDGKKAKIDNAIIVKKTIKIHIVPVDKLNK